MSRACRSTFPAVRKVILKTVSLLFLPALTIAMISSPDIAICAPDKLSSDRPRLNTIARVYIAGESARAAVQLKEYLSEYPTDELAWTILGNAYGDIDRDGDALAAYEKALAIDPQEYRAITGKGILARKKGDNAAAQRYYEEALRIKPDYAEAISSLVGIALANNDPAKAVDYGERAYKLDPNDSTIAANLAVAYHHAHNASRRDEMIKVAEMLGYRNMDALRELAGTQSNSSAASSKATSPNTPAASAPGPSPAGTAP